MPLSDFARQECISSQCQRTFDVSEILTSCTKCGNLLDIKYDWNRLQIPERLNNFERFWSQRRIPQRFSGVWKFHELLPFATIESCLTVGEGQTILQQADGLAPLVDIQPGNLFLQYEGQNPSGSFKDNGMAAALTARQHQRN